MNTDDRTSLIVGEVVVVVVAIVRKRDSRDVAGKDEIVGDGGISCTLDRGASAVLWQTRS